MHRAIVLAFALVACHHDSKPTLKPPVPTATLSGKVHAAGTACEKPGPGCDGPATEYEVIVMATDGKTEVGRTKTDAEGKYTIALPPGEYTIITPAGATGETKRNDIKLESTATLDLELDTGVR